MINPSYAFETKLLKKYRLVAGVDEVGRGPLAGPVVSAIVVLNPDKVGRYRNRSKWWYQVRDSKTLSSRKRGSIVGFIKDNCYDFGIGEATHKEIDELNIHNATLLSMKRAIEALRIEPEVVLIDGMFNIPFDFAQGTIAQRAIVDGDARVLSIASASILAKVYRDDLMNKFSHEFANYGFEKHKGYDTSFHRNKLLAYGPCEIHRMSFSTVRDAMNERWKKLL